MPITEVVNKLVGDKKQWRAYKARTKELPEAYRTAVEGLERYVLNTGPSDGAHLMRMLDDLAELFEQSAAAGTPVREVVGPDPVEFAETFKANYGVMSWLGKEQQRLVDAIAAAERDQATGSGPA